MAVMGGFNVVWLGAEQSVGWVKGMDQRGKGGY